METKQLEVNPFERIEEVRSFEVCPELTMNIAGIARKFQEIAWEHASILKYGFQDLEERGLHWVLNRTEINIIQSPHWTDKIKLRTWPAGLDSLFLLRDFEYRNSKGDLCVTGSSDWLIINKQLRPQIPKHLLTEIPCYTKERSIAKNPQKLIIKEKLDFVFKIQIRHTDLDLNLHTNNVRYYQWACDCLAEKGLAENKIKRFEMNFLHESRLGDILNLQYKFHDNAHWVKGTKDDGTDVFLSRASI